MNKRHWLRIGSLFFIISFLISSYAAFVILQNVARVHVIGQPETFDVRDYLHLIPGINSLNLFAYGGATGMIIGVIILSSLYGSVGMIIGLIYGKVKNQQHGTTMK